MSVSFSCHCGERLRPIGHRHWWCVRYKERCCAFDGYRVMPSEYSDGYCQVCGALGRTKAAYVDNLNHGDLVRLRNLEEGHIVEETCRLILDDPDRYGAMWDLRLALRYDSLLHRPAVYDEESGSVSLKMSELDSFLFFQLVQIRRFLDGLAR